MRCLLGEADGSLEQLEAISGVLRQSGFFPGEWWTVYLAQAYLRHGRPADACDTLLGMRAAYPNVRNHLHATFDALVLADACVALGGAENLTGAEAEYRECLRMAEPAGIHKWTALCDFGLDRSRAAQGRIDEAREHFTKALERLEHHGILLEPERVRAELAKLPAAHW